MTRWCLPWLAVLALGCDGGADPVEVTGAVPAYGPLVGGTQITLFGSGFSSSIASPIEVLIGGRAAPLAAVIDEGSISVVIPPGREPGDAEVVVLSGDRNARATGVFAYSTPPTVATVTPAKVLYSAAGTELTLTGTGFLAEDAGPVAVLIDGVASAEVEVTSDTTLTFTVPGGQALSAPDVEVVNRRGRATRPQAFRYTPSEGRGLLLFPRVGAFAVFYDPIARTTVPVPRLPGAAVRFNAVVRYANGEYWGMASDSRFGRLDLSRQVLEGSVLGPSRFPSLIRVGDGLVGIDRTTLHVGRFDPFTAVFTPITVEPLPASGSLGLASDGEVAYVTHRAAASPMIAPIDLDTGVVGPGVRLIGPLGLHIEDMRFFAGTLYAASRTGTMVTIDPTTGVVTPVAVPGVGRFTAMEVFE